MFGVQQRSILGPSFFSIFICDLFYCLDDFDIANYADESTPYFPGESAELVVNKLEQPSGIIFEWLNDNYMKVKTRKYHLLLSSNSRATAVIDNRCIEQEDENVLPNITIYLTLVFKTTSKVFAREQVKS